MSHSSSTYQIPEAIFDDLDGLTDADRAGLSEVWSMISEDASPVYGSVDNRKDQVRSVVMEQVSHPDAPKMHTVRLPKQPAARIFDLRFRLVSIAAALVVGLSFLLSPSTEHFRSPVGSKMPMLVSLSDGSTVSLSPGSRLSVQDNFGTDNRSVKLHGQAFFDVTAGAVPFQVSTFDATTQVLGTSFSVTAWPGSVEAASEVVVKTGRVSVASRFGKVLLNPGEMTSIDLEGHSPSDPSEANVATSLYWTMGGFYFDEELVENVIKEVERRFDVRIDAPVSIKLRRFSYATKEAVTASDVMGDLAATIGIRYRPTANGFELYLQ